MTTDELRLRFSKIILGEDEEGNPVYLEQGEINQCIKIAQQAKSEWDEKSYNKGFRDGQDVGRYDVLKQ